MKYYSSHEFFEEGKKEGLEEGRKEGREEGREEGIEQGEKRTQNSIIKKCCPWDSHWNLSVSAPINR